MQAAQHHMVASSGTVVSYIVQATSSRLSASVGRGVGLLGILSLVLMLGVLFFMAALLAQTPKRDDESEVYDQIREGRMSAASKYRGGGMFYGSAGVGQAPPPRPPLAPVAPGQPGVNVGGKEYGPPLLSKVGGSEEVIRFSVESSRQDHPARLSRDRSIGTPAHPRPFQQGAFQQGSFVSTATA
mmetsp:Transcript_7945/g.17162  ORF Transcript_7945/g.17162 Transcript_7945/m.17162 type:complete len:185 (+) Transcript_7945:76-630(+)|eukprot:CAMPEP_0170589852 /NCGR_PEP_ID=MMETSP0224-20130122/11560_1 /TAXON_ID=285029 /ORGANISM="Togula jolla, Strain CCCM 725" /LENGTH=184 /DNA_ID=CAMNT_0010913615 /DNA_START=74 /DNA_END=628 /DNA_ORIENTATION=-